MQLDWQLLLYQTVLSPHEVQLVGVTAQVAQILEHASQVAVVVFCMVNLRGQLSMHKVPYLKVPLAQATQSADVVQVKQGN